MERTFAIVKPDAVRRGLSGDILKRIEASGLAIVAMRKIQLSRADAEKFYDVHKARPFFKGLCDYMTAGRWWSRCCRARARSASGVS